MMDGQTQAVQENISVPLPVAQQKKHSFISFFLLLVILAIIPLTVIYLGQKTRQEIKAANDCKTPSIPDPSECEGGTWKLFKNAAGCIRFRCELQ